MKTIIKWLDDHHISRRVAAACLVVAVAACVLVLIMPKNQRVYIKDSSPVPFIYLDGYEVPLYYKETFNATGAKRAWAYPHDGKWVWLNPYTAINP